MKKHPASATKSHAKKGAGSHRAPPGESTAMELDVITIPPFAMSEPPRMSTPTELRTIRFGYFQPDASEVFVVGSFNGWNPRATPLQRDALGDWSIRLPLPPGEHRYRLVVDGEWRDDPTAQQTAKNPFGGFDAVINV